MAKVKSISYSVTYNLLIIFNRYDHYAVLCELIPVGIPSLALCLATLEDEAFTEHVHDNVSQELGFKSRINVIPFPR